MNVDCLDADAPEWESLWRNHSMSTSLVPWWERLSGWEPEVLLLRDGDRVVAGLELLFRRVPYTPVHLTRIVRACVPENPEAGSAAFRKLLEAVDKRCVKRRGIETELRLRLPEGPPAPHYKTHLALEKVADEFGYLVLDTKESTYLVDLTVSDEDRLKSWGSSARNKVRRAERQGVQIAPSRDAGDLELFTESFLAMTARKNAPTLPESYLVGALPPLMAADDVRLYVERYEGQAANLVVVDMRGRPTYALGTRTPANVRGRVPGAAQALQFSIMSALRKEGHQVYDLGGCEGPVPSSRHPNYGVWLFKYELAGTYVELLRPRRKARPPFDRFVHWVHEVRGDPSARGVT